MHLHVAAHWPARGQQADTRVEHGGRRVHVRMQHPIAPRHRLPLHAREVERDPLPHHGEFGRPVLRVQPADTNRDARWRQHQPVGDIDAPGEQRAGHHHPGAGDGEGTIDGETRMAVCVPRRMVQAEQGVPQRLDPLPGYRRDRQHRRARRQQAPQLLRHCVHVAGGEIDAGDRRDHSRNAEEIEDLQVLGGLRHHPVIRRHHQQGGVDAAGAGQHGVDEALMPGHVDESQRAGIGIAEVDGHAAPLLLRQPVGIDAGERAHQRGLAVVDMARGADDQACFPFRPAKLKSGMAWKPSSHAP